MNHSTLIANAAQRLRQAQAERKPIAPLREEIPDGETAYAVQLCNVEHELARGRRIVGRKIGLTSLAVQKQLGVDQPDFGTLFADMIYGDDQPVAVDDILQPKVEAEIALVLAHDIPNADCTLVEMINAVDYVLPAIEIVGSRIENWNIKFIDTVADNASSGAVVVGGSPKKLTEVDIKASQMTMHKRSEQGDVLVSQGAGAACLGHPLNAALWLARKMASLGQPLKAGDLVMTGALGPMVPVARGDRFTVNITGLGTVSANFV